MLTFLLTSLLALSKPASAPVLPAWAQTQWTEAGLGRTFDRAAYAKPGFLSADFNGDGKTDVAILVSRRATGSRGIVMLHQGGAPHQILGTGRNTSREMLQGDLAWADHWRVYRGRTTDEVLFTPSGDLGDTRTIYLKRPTIELTKEEQGGGMIYWNGRRYIWLHQTC
ncbi:hypothetical protein LJY25_11790 [Hymenobacter sp. BT175]|uniref:hypothetical protein n=1 Tax=Hymenobacter translucens TaxID=2886507 RepID=UPI001D0E3D48|nr:hypothetical protein [Hymenobacter translucens]MCC2547130.1 hypothetical protein [Hymenobacter translucens]